MSNISAEVADGQRPSAPGYQITILTEDDVGPTRDRTIPALWGHWDWTIELTRHDDGTISVSAEDGEEEHRVGPREAAQLKEVIEELFATGDLDGEAPHWDAIAANIAPYDRALANQLIASLAADAPAQIAAREAMAKQRRDTAAVDAWCERAEWPPSQGIHAWGGNNIRSHVVRCYTKAYLAEHGRLPTGHHTIDGEFGSEQTYQAARRRSVPHWCWRPQSVRLEVDYPEQAE